MDGVAISVRGLRKSYGALEALRGIDLEVRSGEVFGLLGPNGAGKTTAIEILEGYRERSAGEVRVLGIDPARPTRAWRDRVGLVLQECELDPLLSVAETLSLFGAFYEHPRPPREIVELVGLADKRDARMGTLSGGQRRRADVAVALVGDPDLVFLDEPTTGFDPGARRDAWKMIEELKGLGKTILLTTHYMDEAEHLADRVAILRGGCIVATGRLDELTGAQAKTTISFRMPRGVTPEDLRTASEHEPSFVGDVASVQVGDAQRALYRLTTWAEREGVRVEAIEVRQPSLEDLFLELTGGED